MHGSESYIYIIQTLIRAGFKMSLDWNSPSTNNKLLLRHDIDFSVEHAFRLAKIESNLDVRSTYFFMLTSNMYNLMSSRNCKLISDIRDMGHKIAIHFDPTVYENLQSFDLEKKVFEYIFNVKIDIISIHRPGVFLDNNNVKICGVSQTYHDKYFKKMKYISDSGGRDIFKIVNELSPDKTIGGLHLLVHPIWWIETANSPTQALNQWKRWNNEFIRSEIKDNCKSYID